MLDSQLWSWILSFSTFVPIQIKSFQTMQSRIEKRKPSEDEDASDDEVSVGPTIDPSNAGHKKKRIICSDDDEPDLIMSMVVPAKVSGIYSS